MPAFAGMTNSRLLFLAVFLAQVAAADLAAAQTLFRDWHLTMSDIQARSRVAIIRGERLHDAQGAVRVKGVLAARVGSEAQPEEFFFDMDLATTLLRNTEYDPDLVRSAVAVGYRHRRRGYTVDLYGEHLRRMNTDTAARRNGNFFGASISDPEFHLRRFGSRSRMHGKIGAGSLVNENGFKGNARYLAALRYDALEFAGRKGRMRLPKGQIFLEGEIDAIHGPGGFMTDLEAGVRFLFFPEADNSLSIAAKFYDSKNPYGHGDDGVRIDLDLEGSHAGELFRSFLGNTAGEIGMGIRGDDVATELQADFDLVKFRSKNKTYVIVLDTLQRLTWGKLNKIQYDLVGGLETTMDENPGGLIAGIYLDHRSTHGLDRNLKEKSYNAVRGALKTPGWDRGRENETLNRLAFLFSIGGYIDNTFKKNRDVDARAGIRFDGRDRPWHSWTVTPYLMGTVRNATNEGSTFEHTVELGMRFNGNALFARWSQEAFFEEGGYGGLAFRF
ncbi:hypothetical protein HY522_09965 [bacterium]|nr:hypothetical protein [bacterium]